MSGRGRRLREQFYAANRMPLFLAVLCTLLTAAVNILIAWVMQQMIDTATGVPHAMSLQMIASLIAGILAAVVLIKLISRQAKPYFIRKAMLQYREAAYERLMKKNIAAFGLENTAEYLSAFTNDASVIETGYLEGQLDMLSDFSTSVLALLLMIAYSPLMTLISCAFFMLPIGAALTAGNRAEQAERNVSEKNIKFTASLKDILSGFSVIKSFQAEDAVQAVFQKENTETADAGYQKRRLLITIGLVSGIAGVAAQLGTFFAGICLLKAGWKITPGVLIAFIDLTGNVIVPIQQLPERAAAWKAASSLTDRLAERLERNVREDGKKELESFKTGIDVKNVSFCYDGDTDVLHDVCLHLEKGKCYALVGASGSGKSTLLNLLTAGHAGYQGEIDYDGHEVRQISSHSLFRTVSLIQQNVFVFNASIRDNITMFRSFDPAETEHVAQLSGLAEVIRNKGQDYRCGENGNGLSGGEKQRIAIARSLLKKSQVLLVDEATSSLDAGTASGIHKTILGLDGILRIVVTHRLDAGFLRRCDGILVMKNGSIAEQGTFDGLMKEKGYFYSLYNVSL